MKNELTLGSLFDGSGGFPLGGMFAGITPLWASEIEPFAVRVTTKRLPQMKHYGDVSALNGADLPPVDIITFGSPCQDMSIAGKRSGLDGSRSSLFYEAVRIIKEMRCATNGKYPRFAVWENVHGAFSSNKGEDFRAVLVASDYKDPPAVNSPEYIVRRLTPTECARLQGFPDWWCADLGTDEPTDEELRFWKEVFETHRKIIGSAVKPKSEKQIRAWLKNPHSDSAEYKLWGNGVALPCVYFVLAGIAWVSSCSN